MALTYELADSHSPVRQFFERRFPKASFGAISKRWYATVRAANIVCPPPTGVNPGTLGTAFEYRARLCWAPLDWKVTVAAHGARNARGYGEDNLAELFPRLGAELERFGTNRCAGDLAVDDEDRLCRVSYALALYEQFFRSAQAAFSSPLLELPSKASVEELLAVAPREAVDDLASMTHLLCADHPNLIDTPAVLNPTFDGSIEIGGADADLIAAGTLLDLKTTKQDTFERVGHLYQLLGYVLLDYSNRYSIDAVAIYLARRGTLIEWPLDELLAECCDSNDLAELRGDFAKAVEAAEAAL